MYFVPEKTKDLGFPYPRVKKMNFNFEEQKFDQGFSLKRVLWLIK